MEHLYNDSKWRLVSLRRQVHEQGKELKRLRAELGEAREEARKHQKSANLAESNLSRQQRQTEKVSAMLETEKVAYRGRAQDRQLAKHVAKENLALHADINAMQIEAASKQSALELLESRLQSESASRQSSEEAVFIAKAASRAAEQRAKEAERAMKLAYLVKEVEVQKVEELSTARDALLAELGEVRMHANTLAEAAAALTVPKYRNVNEVTMSYRTKCRAHQEDRDYFKTILVERTWRACDIATALHEADLLKGVFETTEVRLAPLPHLNRLTAY